MSQLWIGRTVESTCQVPSVTSAVITSNVVRAVTIHVTLMGSPYTLLNICMWRRISPGYIIFQVGGMSFIGLATPMLPHQLYHTFKSEFVSLSMLLLRWPLRKSFNSLSLRTSTLGGGGRVLHAESISGGGAGTGTVSEAVLELDS